MSKAELRAAMPGCLEIVDAFRVFEPRVTFMSENGIVWQRD